MTVYVDDARIRYGRLVMCHMIADSPSELLVMAESIGVARRWLQCAGTHHEHFDICMAKRAIAVSRGAKETTSHDIARHLAALHGEEEKP